MNVVITRDGLVHPEWAMVLGGGAGVWEEVLAWEALYGRQWDGQVVAANDVGAYWPRHLDHWVSLHPDKFKNWELLRKKQGHPAGYILWARRRHRDNIEHFVNPWGGGSSGMLAAQVALTLGCRRVVLCGIPMTQTPHFAESREFRVGNTTWAAAEGHWRAWQKCQDRFLGSTRSMSGRTQEMLGAPTVAWLREEEGPLLS